MKTNFFLVSFLAIAAPMFYHDATADAVVYKITMNLKVPRVYDNTQSLGYRKPQRQSIVGYVMVDKSADPGQYEPLISFFDMENRTHKIGGKRVTYMDSYADEVMWRYIGNNRTGIFRNTLVKFRMDMNPSYNIGEDEPDNTLIVTLSGFGSSERSIFGGVTGQIGCGCMAYGHISPTRNIYCMVVDTAPLYGTFRMTRMNQVCLLASSE